ncbi:D-alanyl-D-alanine carboxypeptidase family protein [Dehalobacterium formicoaceticum]|uniref:serine-type D-Ala-D-Ala carboxypeptidase n=1 Tax=Dehalobacterium formicoaceticum TaxID=51515 RepID=A0ABT1Y4P9_9FIRM|nr:D-alanyl-D-alanine carboxypeptidase family protein [Dehalobacterium formicoaceticum]MCR6545848.1 D-alanyl-D-alanine carboxypeptidase [Dehalobacterium formicoaceticum]
MKRSLFNIFMIIVMTFGVVSGTAYASPEVTAKSAILIDASSGRILFEKNAHERLPQASTTKITTALLALENADLSKQVQVPADFVNPGESNIYLGPGEVHPMEDLLYALLLKSANDAAEVIAIDIGGSVEQFAEMMNKRVKEMGLKDTHYVNPHGLNDERHYTSAYDLAMIAREALKNEKFREIVNTNKYEIPWEGNEYNRVAYNTNRLLKTYEGADGVKTGFTRQAGSCLVGSATRNGMQLIAVTLNCNGMYQEMTALFDYGFQNYQKKEIFEENQTAGQIPVKGGTSKTVHAVAKAPLGVAFNIKDKDLLEPSIYLPEKIKAPVKEGQRLGSAVVKIDENTFVTTELVAANDVGKSSFFAYLWDTFISAII